MKIELSELANVKGIGGKTLKRIREQVKDKRDYNNQYDDTIDISEINQGDCLELLKGLEDNSVDAIVTDPPYEIGFMGKGWDGTGIANNIDLWSACLRVLKPGGYLLSFSSTRTYQDMASAIQEAGFEIRDMIEWVYGTGFPKSHNIGKQLLKEAEKQISLQTNDKIIWS